MLARGHFAHFHPVHEGLHTDDTFGGVELINRFVVFLELEKRDQLLVAFNERFMHDDGHSFPFLLSLLATGSATTILVALRTDCRDSLVTKVSLSVSIGSLSLRHTLNVCVDAMFVPKLATQAKEDSAAGEAKAAEKGQHEE